MDSPPTPAKNGPVLSLLFTLLGLNRAGQILYVTLFVLAVPMLMAWTVWLPRFRFTDEDERLFRAARHGDRAALEQSLASGARVNGVSPVDGKTALFRAAVLGQPGAVRVLLEHGADLNARGADGQSPIEVVTAARAAEKDSDLSHALDEVLAVLREAESRQ